MPQRALWKLPLTGGRQTEVLSGLAADGCSYAPARNGIYFMRNGPHSNTQELAFLRFDTGQITRLALISRHAALGFALSPDEHLLLYGQTDQLGSDLMLAEESH